MEASEVHEYQEQQAEAFEKKELLPVSFTISVLAMLVALTTVMGHRSHTEAVLEQARASDQWNLYQAKKIRDNETQLTQDIISHVQTNNAVDAAKLLEVYKTHREKWVEDLEQEQETAREFEAGVHKAERKAKNFDIGEALLQIAVVITAVTMLTRNQLFWYLGMLFGAAGLVFAVLGFLVK